MTPSSVLEDLMQGNQRFINGTMETRGYQEQRKSTVSGQFPKAVVLSCIDSRVPVETVFDQGIGDVFVARVAGNFENVDILGSLEYSCKVAGSKLVLVLGHESCGAVKSACIWVELGNITAMLQNVVPAVEQATKEVAGPYNADNAGFVARVVENNVNMTVARIRERSPILKEMEDNGEIAIMGGVYQLATGKVVLF